jgi:alpha-L-rhamnosidase
MLGKTKDAEKYAELAKNIRRSYNKRFYKGDGIYANGSQASLSAPIYQGLVEQQEKDLVVQKLVERVEATNYNYETGTVSTKFILPVLSDHGRIDVAYKIATQTTIGSLGYWATHGGTALWEDWTGEEGSRNHVSAFGYVGEWFYKYLAGINIDPEQPAFKHIIIRPMPVGDLTWVKAEHESRYGTIRSSWRIKDRNLSLHVTIPANTAATVYVPAESADSVTESGEPAAQSEGVVFVRTEGRAAVYLIGSGSYAFGSRLPDKGP